MKRLSKKRDIQLFHGDCLEILEKLPDNSVDMIFADPPYFLSNGGLTCKAGKMVSVNKANWDKSKGLTKDFEFTLQWLEACRRVLKENGTIWVSGTMHNIYQVGFGLQYLDYKVLNEISWFKPNASPNLACRSFTHSHETLIWARKHAKKPHKFNYEETRQWEDKINPANKQTRSVWHIPLTSQKEKIHGKHPTQKPLELLRRIISSSTEKGAVILDPFNGSGTTGVVAKMLGRKYIGIDMDRKYLELSVKRIKSI
jgi:site-specific DNA-methyltransferase (adenine-specific)